MGARGVMDHDGATRDATGHGQGRFSGCLTHHVTGSATIWCMDPKHFLNKIKQSQDAAEIIQLCVVAAAPYLALPVKERKAWLQQNALSADTWEKVVKIAQAAEDLCEPGLLSHLPANFSTLALLSRCSRDDVAEARRQGLITPDLSHRALPHGASRERNSN